MRIVGSGVALITVVCATVASHAACLNPSLGERVLAEWNARVELRALAVTEEEQKLAALDRVVTPRDIAEAAACLEAALLAQAAALPPSVSTYRGWRTDGQFHLFPGNEYAYGRVFASPAAASYFANAVVGGVGSTVVKETFRFSSDGTAHVHEIGVMEGLGPHRNEASAWGWHVVKAQGKLEQGAEPCLVCHQWQQHRAFQFGYGMITTPKR